MTIFLLYFPLPFKYPTFCDTSSFHFFLQNKGKWKSIAIGDYTLQIGQGLVLASGFYLGKGAETILTVRRNSLGIRPYSSVIENNFFRGAAATYQIGGFEFTGFASRNRRSGNLVYDKKSYTIEPVKRFFSFDFGVFLNKKVT